MSKKSKRLRNRFRWEDAKKEAYVETQRRLILPAPKSKVAIGEIKKQIIKNNYQSEKARSREIPETDLCIKIIEVLHKDYGNIFDSTSNKFIFDDESFIQLYANNLLLISY